ncbi:MULTISPECIES: DUF3795 domain-containing protein [Blautia]|uniref:DUF3795 domain-containing protein n=1 Tax=Blautia TaxID=572511 RepID=UPI000BA4B104|nr:MULTISPECIES: DUF3795 domain-containing protein [Blautia]
MHRESPFVTCPVYETRSFKLRLVRKEDAAGLLACYADKDAVGRMNADRCTSNFYYQTMEEMQDCIAFWLSEYEKKYYVRFAVLFKENGKAVGTMEIYPGEKSVLRLDLASEFEQEEYVEELLVNALDHWYFDFGIDVIVLKADNTPKRLPVYEKLGFRESDFRAGCGYLERGQKKYFDVKKGIAFCGLACCVCSENEMCSGCRGDTCICEENCTIRPCCLQKGIEGCWECEEFPCKEKMFDSVRIRAFGKYIEEYGMDLLMERLKKNEEAKMQYHHYGKLTGDYDGLENETAVIALLHDR